MIQTFGEQTYVQVLSPGDDALSNAKYPASGSFKDVSQFERFAFLVSIGTLADAIDVKVQQATAANGTPKDITGAAKTDIVDTNDDKWFMIEVETRKLDISNDYRYVTLDVSGNSGTNNACIIFLGINPGEAPVTQHAGLLQHVFVGG